MDTVNTDEYEEDYEFPPVEDHGIEVSVDKVPEVDELRDLALQQALGRSRILDGTALEGVVQEGEILERAKRIAKERMPNRFSKVKEQEQVLINRGFITARTQGGMPKKNRTRNSAGVEVVNLRRHDVLAMLARRKLGIKDEVRIAEAMLTVDDNYEPMLGAPGWDEYEGLDDEWMTSMEVLRLEDRIYGRHTNSIENVIGIEARGRNIREEIVQQRLRDVTAMSKAERRLRLMHDHNMSKPSTAEDLFVELQEVSDEPVDAFARYAPGDPSSLKYVQQDRLNAALPQHRLDLQDTDRSDRIKLSVDDPAQATIAEQDGPKYLIPQDIAMAMKRRSLTAPPEGERLSGEELRIDNTNWESDTLDAYTLGTLRQLKNKPQGEPGYWVHLQDEDGTWQTYAVFGYMGDHGYRSLQSPEIPMVEDTENLDENGRPTKKWAILNWKNTNWLHRCAQCGRELPAIYYHISNSGHCNPTCKGCQRVNKVAAELMNVATKYWNIQELRFMAHLADLLRTQWRSNLAPRGPYAEQILGQANIKDRIYETRYRKQKPEDTSKGRKGKNKRKSGGKAILAYDSGQHASTRRAGRTWASMDRYCGLLDEMLHDNTLMHRGDTEIYKEISSTSKKIESVIEELDYEENPQE